MSRILINNCGSQAKDIIRLIKEDKNNYVIYLTYSNQDRFSKVADLVIEDIHYTVIEEYVIALLDICEKYAIDIFIPFNSMVDLIDFRQMFKEKGIKLLVGSDNKVFKCLNDKARTYELLGDDYKDYQPLYYEVHNYKELKEACESLRCIGKEVCIKYTVDIASNSFRIINFENRDIAELEVKGQELASKLSKMIDYGVLLDMFFYAYGVDDFEKTLLVMEYLDGKEVSCDCLYTNKLKVIIPRIKSSGIRQEIVNDEKIKNVCESILVKTRYDGPCNIQFKYTNEGHLKLLEVNTRLSGGVMISSDATSVNIPLLAVKNTAGELTGEENIIFEDCLVEQQKVWNFLK